MSSTICTFHYAILCRFSGPPKSRPNAPTRDPRGMNGDNGRGFWKGTCCGYKGELLVFVEGELAEKEILEVGFVDVVVGGLTEIFEERRENGRIGEVGI